MCGRSGASNDDAVAQAVKEVPEGMLSLAGWPSCLLSNRPRDAAQVIALYFLGQSRAYHPVCSGCAQRDRCPGLVEALLARDGDNSLRPS